MKRPVFEPAGRAFSRMLAWTMMLALLTIAAPSLAAPAVREAAPTSRLLPIDQVRAGQVGYGLSVFAGLEPKKFKVRVLGVIRNSAPNQSMILAELSGEGLETSGVVAGMSGSPVYIGGRLAGAVAFSWPFSKRPVAGITPINEMRNLLAQPAGTANVAGEEKAPSIHELLAGLPSDSLGEALRRLGRGAGYRSSSGLSWSAVGFGPEGMSLVEQSLSSVSPVGGSRVKARGKLEPGSSVAGVLVDGDLKLAVVGTVTDRIGNTILAFGHPFLGVGRLLLPMAPADVVTVLASQYSSFKISNLGPTVGAFDLDRSVGVRGRLGLEAPMIPLDVELRDGGKRTTYHMRVADVPEISPTLIASSFYGAVDAASHASGESSLDLAADFDLGARGNLAIRQSFDGASATLDSAVYLLGISSYLESNALAHVKIDGIHVRVRQFEHPRTARLVAAHASQTLVRPGEVVQIALDLVAYRGAPFRRTLQLHLPTDLPEGRYSLLVGDGPDIDAARLLLEHLEPVSFGQALSLLRSFHSRRDLVILGLFGAPGISVAGTVLPQLPGSIGTIWGAASSGSAQPLALSVAQVRSETLERPIDGVVRIDLEVRHREPLTSSGKTDTGEASTPAGKHKPAVRGVSNNQHSGTQKGEKSQRKEHS